jgi:hypothetical protein
MEAILFLLLILAVVVVGLFALRNLRTIRKMRFTRSEIKALDKEDNVLISPRSLQRLHHELADDENQVLWADRRHWFTAWRVIAFGAAAALFGGLTLILAIWPIGFTINQQRWTVGYQWTLPLVLCLASSAAAWTGWLRWSAEYRILTNKRLLLITQPWEWAVWLWKIEEIDPLPIEAVLTVEVSRTYWGNLYGYGSLKVKSLLQDSEDIEFHEITYTRRSREFKDAIDRAVSENKVKLVAVGSTIMPVQEAG